MAGSNDGSLFFDTKINTDSFEEDIKKLKDTAESSGKKVKDEVSKTTKGIEDEVEKVTRSTKKKIKETADTSADLVKAVNKAAVGVAAGIAGATATVIGMGVSYNSEIENYTASFETMLGSAQAADKTLRGLKSFAEKTPFELSDLAQASTTLLAFDEDIEDLMPDLKTLGDISLGNKEKFSGLALVFGQVKSQGKLMGQDLLQMINQGFNPLQIISEKTGESMSSLKDKMSKGQITFEMVADAMKTATSAGGKFYNAMDKQSQTFAGQTSTLTDNINSLFGEMSEGVSKELTETILPMAIEKVEELKEAWADGTLQQGIKTTTILLSGAGATIAGLNIGMMVKDVTKVIKLGEAHVATTKAGTVAQKLLNAEILKNPYAVSAVALVALTTGLIAFVNHAKDAEATQLVEKTKEQTKAWNELTDAVRKSTNAGVSQIDHTKVLSDELRDLANESGIVAEKDKARAEFILGELNKALGTEYELTGNQIANYKELEKSIDAVIAKKRAEIILSAQEEAYTEAVKNKNEALRRQGELLSKIKEIENDGNLLNDVQLSDLQEQLEENQILLDAYYTTIEGYESDYAAIASGNTDKIEEINTRRSNSYFNAATNNTASLGREVAETKKLYEGYLEEVQAGTRSIDDQIVKDAGVQYNNALKAYQKASGAIPQGYILGIQEKGGLITVSLESVLTQTETQATAFANMRFPFVGEAISEGVGSGIGFTPFVRQRIQGFMADTYGETKKAGQINSPSKLFKDGIGKWLSLGVAQGIEENSDAAVKSFNKMLEKLQYQRDFDIINEREYYTELEKLRDKYFKTGTKEWLDYSQEIYSYQKKTIEDLYSDISSFANKTLDDIISNQEELASKLSSYGSLFNTNTVTMGEESFTFYSMHDFEKDIQAITEYGNSLQRLKDRFKTLGADDDAAKSFIAELAEEDINTGTAVLNMLLSSGDDKLLQYITGYARKNAAAGNVSSSFYQDDMNTAIDKSIENMKQKLTEAGYEIPEGFFVSGSISAEKFGEAFVQKLEEEMEGIRTKIADFNAKLELELADMGSVGATVNTKTYSPTYQIIASPEESTAGQLRTIRNEEKLNEMRGGY